MKSRITKRTITDRQTINYLIKHFNLKRLRAWKKQSWDESNHNNEIIDNLKEIREKLEVLDYLISKINQVDCGTGWIEFNIEVMDNPSEYENEENENKKKLNALLQEARQHI